MPGSICVTVMEAFDLPERIADGEEIVVKVVVGPREFQTEPNKTFDGKTTPCSQDFVFPVLNLRDNLLVMLLDKNGEIISENEIGTPSIVEKGSFESRLFLNGGGGIHLSLSFVLTDEERRRIDTMRAAALKRREQAAIKPALDSQLLQEETESTVQQSNKPQSNDSDVESLSSPQQPLRGFESGQELDTRDHQNLKLSPTEVSSCNKYEEHTPLETSVDPLGESSESNEGSSSFNSVKDRIKSFERSRTKGSNKPDSPASSPQVRTFDHGMKHSDGQEGDLWEEDAKRREDTKSSSGCQKESVEAVKSISESDLTDSGLLEVECFQNEKAYLHNRDEKGIRSKLDPVTNVDSAKTREAVMRHKKSPVKAPKYKKRHVNLDGISRQVFHGAIVGLISGAVLIAAGAFLWGRKSNKRNKRNIRGYQQITYHGTKK